MLYTEGALKISDISDNLSHIGHHDYFNLSMDMLTPHPNFMTMDLTCQTSMKNEALKTEPVCSLWNRLSIYTTHEMRDELWAEMRGRVHSLECFYSNAEQLCETHTFI